MDALVALCRVDIPDRRDVLHNSLANISAKDASKLAWLKFRESHLLGATPAWWWEMPLK